MNVTNSAGQWSISLTSGVVVGILAALVAASKDRSVIGWLILGLIFNCFALIIVCVLPSLKDQQDRLTVQELETRRVKERLRQEQIKNRRFRESLEARVSAHDVALGMNTRDGTFSNALPPKIQAEEPCWYYDDQGHPAGPISRSALLDLRRINHITPDTLVWCEGLTTWKPFADVLT